MDKSDYSQCIVLSPERFADVDFRKDSECRILRAFGITREDMDSAISPCLFPEMEKGQAFVCKTETRCYVLVKLNNNNAGGGDNSVDIGGKSTLFGGLHDFRNGSIVVGVRTRCVCFPIPGKIFDNRERRALRHA